MPMNPPPLTPKPDRTADPSLGLPETPDLTGGAGYVSRTTNTGGADVLKLLKTIQERIEKVEKHLDRLANKNDEGLVPDILKRLEKVEAHLDDLVGRPGSGEREARRASGSVPTRSRSR